MQKSYLMVMNDYGLLDWSSLWVGFKRGWVQKKDIIDYAVDWLLRYSEEENQHIILLAGGEFMDERDFQDEFVNYLKEEIEALPDIYQSEEVDKWRLAALKCLQNNNITDEDKLGQLELMYADFDYPEDMAQCSQYYVPPDLPDSWEIGDKIGSCPLEALNRVIQKLEGDLIEGNEKSE
jgi:hypothetical protein